MSIPLPQLPKNVAPYKFPCIINQHGSSLVLALFVIIILSLLGSILMRMISTSSETVSQEVLGTRAYMAANSAMQAELQLLFPLNAIGVCNATNIAPYNFQTAGNADIPGLYDCEAFTTCDNYYSDTEDPLAVVRYYRLTSTGECGSGTIETDSKDVVVSSRTIQVEARSL
jgi:MSHA biogenesis protein MshP